MVEGHHPPKKSQADGGWWVKTSTPEIRRETTAVEVAANTTAVEVAANTTNVESDSKVEEAPLHAKGTLAVKAREAPSPTPGDH